MTVRVLLLWLISALLFVALRAVRAADSTAVGGDNRIRTVPYRADAVYRLHGVVGYQIDIQFETGEHLLGLGSGDADGIDYVAQDNHVFIKPKALNVKTNLTLLTSQRVYYFDYSSERTLQSAADGVYALRFLYPPRPGSDTQASDALLRAAPAARPHNRDYWFCGQRSMAPIAAWDDGVQTHLQFAGGRDLPAVFVRNEDGSESLLNFSVQQGELVLQRVASRLIVRRGALTGCIVNRAFVGSGTTLDSGTLSPQVQRQSRGSNDEVP